MNVATPVVALREPSVNLAKLLSSRYNDKSTVVSVPTSSVYVNILALILSDVVVSVSVNTALRGTSVNTCVSSTLAANASVNPSTLETT